jgi:hypothetical protein
MNQLGEIHLQDTAEFIDLLNFYVNFDIKLNDYDPQGTSHQLANVHLQEAIDSIDISNIDVNFDNELDNPLGTNQLREITLGKAAESIDIPHVDVNFDSKGTRFGNIVDDSEIQVLIERQENINTKKNTWWAFNIFENWRLERSSRGQGQEYDIPELISMDAVHLNFLLRRFIMSARKRDGKNSILHKLWHFKTPSRQWDLWQKLS